MFALTWPAASAMSSMATPLADAIDTNVCRVSRGCQSVPSPARSITSLNLTFIRWRDIGRPGESLNTSLGPWLAVWEHRQERDAHARRCASDAIDHHHHHHRLEYLAGQIRRARVIL